MNEWKDVSNLAEQLDFFEERYGVKIQGLFITSNDEFRIIITGELYAREGNKLTKDIQLIITVHDVDGRIVDRGQIDFQAAWFFAFRAFSISFNLPISLSKVAKVRVYPQSIC
ncbi:hypothetical protein LBMAG56_05870 [Verrucomicrobiota bacterium]|nr:hypothetical protein LBMAG56_05870 [Verrucomicrobiota bacterium]